MRFEVISAWIIGALLPFLETLRRGIGHFRVDFVTMFEDYLAGALLLVAAWLSRRPRPLAPLFLILAWAYCTGMMGSSFWGHLEHTIRRWESDCGNTIVLLFKLLLWGTCVTSLILSFRQAARR